MISLAEDPLKDEALTLRALKKSGSWRCSSPRDGVGTLDFFFGTGLQSEHDTSVMSQTTQLDRELPKVDGLEVLKSILADERTRRLPGVVFTSSSEEEDIIKSGPK